MSEVSEQAKVNTDREIFREIEGDYYSSSVSVTESGSLQLNVGGLVLSMSIREWHKLASECPFCGGEKYWGPESIERHIGDCRDYQ